LGAVIDGRALHRAAPWGTQAVWQLAGPTGCGCGQNDDLLLFIVSSKFQNSFFSLNIPEIHLTSKISLNL
jgi:hypothetical protein